MQKSLTQRFEGFVIPFFSFRKALDKNSKENMQDKVYIYIKKKNEFTGKEKL